LTRALAEAAESFTKVFHALLRFFPHNVAPDFLQYISGIQSREGQNNEKKFEL
jgi:hypothetical protein